MFEFHASHHTADCFLRAPPCSRVVCGWERSTTRCHQEGAFDYIACYLFISCLFTSLFVYFCLLFVCFLAWVKYPMTKVYQKLFPVILQLACDVERVRMPAPLVHVKQCCAILHSKCLGGVSMHLIIVM